MDKLKEYGQEGGSRPKDKEKEDHVADDAPTPERPKSPDASCSICLGPIENKAFADSCYHTFCFICLLEWSKVRTVCPLCKQPFKSIIHNVRTLEDYDQYNLPENNPDNRFRYRTTMTGRWQDRRQLEEERQHQLLQRPTQSHARSSYRYRRQAATSDFRRRIYNQGMYVKELRRANGDRVHCREICPSWFRRYPACSHRLVPWLNRELNAISISEDNQQFLLELILDLIKRYNILSEEFYQHLQAFFGRKTKHFIHEFYSFARSPLDMINYDRNALYEEPSAPPVMEVSSSEGSDHDDDLPPGEGNVEDDEVIFVQNIVQSQVPGSSKSGLLNRIPNVTISEGTSGTRNREEKKESTDTSDSDDDIEVVKVEEPWSKRSPLLVMISSDDDKSSTSKKSKHKKKEKRKKHKDKKKKKSKDREKEKERERLKRRKYKEKRRRLKEKSRCNSDKETEKKSSEQGDISIENHLDTSEMQSSIFAQGHETNTVNNDPTQPKHIIFSDSDSDSRPDRKKLKSSVIQPESSTSSQSKPQTWKKNSSGHKSSKGSKSSSTLRSVVIIPEEAANKVETVSLVNTSLSETDISSYHSDISDKDLPL